MRVDQWWTVGPYRFEQVVDHAFDKITSGPMYRFAIDGKISSEMFESLDRAMVAAVGERSMGPRGASGNAVGTAADWFCVMIGLTEAEAEQREPAPAKQERLCPGRGRAWQAHRALGSTQVTPRCPACGGAPEDIDAERPVSVKDGWAGRVPEHLIPQD